MPFDSIQGQSAALGTLKRMLQTRRVHHALRFEGPDGVGKEMTAMAFAQALVCTEGAPFGCGSCSACRRAVELCEGPPAVPLHPDVIFIERGLYPPETLGRSRVETQDISVDQIRTVVLEKIAYRPHEERARVFIIKRAEELSTSAANSLLKTLEEPGSDTHFVLLVSNPAGLPTTILSRSLRIRFAPLPDSVIADILRKRNVEPQRAEDLATLAAGSASAALELAESETSSDTESFLSEAMAAIDAKDPLLLLQLADSRTKDKPLLRHNLVALAARIAREARDATFRKDPRAPDLALRYQIVLQSLREMDRNASPALLVESLMMRLRASAG